MRWSRLDSAAVVLVLVLAGWLVVGAGGRGSLLSTPLLVVGCVATLLLSRAITRRHTWAVAGLVVAAVSAVAVAAGSEAVDTLRGPLGYANATAALYTVGVGAACLVAVRARSWPVRGLAALLAVGLAVLPFLARSLAAAAGAVVVLGVTVVVTVRPRTARPLVALAGIGTVVVFVATVVAGATYVDRGGDPSAGLLSHRRLVLWSEALDLIAAEPATGVGIGRFAETAPTAIADADARWAHAELLELGAEAGVPALALGLALLVWAFVWLDRGSGRRGAAIAAMTLAASSAQAHVDYVWHHPAVLLALAAVVGAGATVGGSTRRPGFGHSGLVMGGRKRTSR